jgi:hypothetical protein
MSRGLGMMVVAITFKFAAGVVFVPPGRNGRFPLVSRVQTCPAAGRKLWVSYQVKAFEKHRFRPTYAWANVGHPSCLGATALNLTALDSRWT